MPPKKKKAETDSIEKPLSNNGETVSLDQDDL